MLGRIDHLKKFLPGLWCIRWVDLVSTFGRVSPSISVLLCKLPEEMTDAEAGKLDHNKVREVLRKATFAGKSLEQQVRLVPTGAIPGMVIGSLFRDGRRVGALDVPVKRFIATGADEGPVPSVVATANKPLKTPLSKTWAGQNFKTLSASSYRLGRDYCNGYCLEFDGGDDGVLILPCVEVFRSFYAPVTPMANALTSKPWISAAQDLADPERTYVLKNDEPNGKERWQLFLRRQLDSDTAHMLLANLMISPAGIKAANQIHDYLHAETTFKGAAGGISYLGAGIPFDWNRLEIRVRCLYLHLNKYVGVEIVGAKWKGPDEIVVITETVKKDGEEGDQREPYRQELTTFPLDEEYLVIDPEKDAKKGKPESIMAPSALWADEPEWRHETEPRVRKPGAPSIKEVVDAHEGSVGNEGESGSAIAAASYDKPTDIGGSAHFDKVIQVFEALFPKKNTAKSGQVPEQGSFDFTRPTGNGVARGGRPVWLFPPEMTISGKPKAGWSLQRGRGKNKLWVRTALVLEFTRGGASGCWIEIDARQKGAKIDKRENYCSFVYRIDPSVSEDQRKSVVRALLNHVSAKVKSSDSMRSKNPGVWRIDECVTHCGVKPVLYKHIPAGKGLNVSYAETRIDAALRAKMF